MTKKPKLTKAEKRNYVGMLGLNTCKQVLALFVNVFLVAQIYLITDYNLTAVALFVLVYVTALCLFYFVASILCKKIPAIWITRTSTFLVCLFLLMVVLWSDGLYDFFMLFGLFWGIIQGLHWGAMNFLITKVFKKDRTLTFYIIFNALIAFIGIVFPITFGLAIDLGSLLITSIFVLCIGLIQLGFSFVIKIEKTITTKEERKLHFPQYFRALKEKNHLKPAFILWVQIIFAGIPYTLAALMTVIILIAYGSNTSLGVLGSIFGAVGIIGLFTYKIAKPKIKAPMFFIAAFLPLLASIGLFFFISPTTAIIFNAAIIFRNMINVEENNTRINATRYWGGEQYVIESHMFYEFALWIGRIIACGILVIVGGVFNAHPIALATAISLILVALAIHATMLFFWKKKYVTLNDNEKETEQSTIEQITEPNIKRPSNEQ